MRYIIPIIAMLLLVSSEAYPQLGASNLMEVQYGKLPNESADPFVSIYNRTKTNYYRGDWQGGFTLEGYGSQYGDRNYFFLSQGYLRYKHRPWDIQIGNLYETFGRGLLLRSFEVQGAVIEDISFRSRTYFHKDILGARAQYKHKRGQIQILAGQVLDNIFPPTFQRSVRRPDDIYMVDTDYKYFKKHTIGLTAGGINSPNADFRPLSAVRLKGPLASQFNYYAEWALNWNVDESYGTYIGISGAIGAVGINLEYKNYKNFILGAGINEPPALIKQHTYRVLNRSTHVSNPANEEGYQIDLFYTSEKGSSINFNHARATNGPGLTFQEYFLEWSNTLSDKLDYKIFVDWAQDPLKGESNRLSMGTNWSLQISKNLTLTPEMEYQQFNRSTGTVDNQAYGLTFKIMRKWTATLLYESTNDPFRLADSSRRQFFGGTVGYKPSYDHRIQLFAGERRGGPACSGGVCYEILDFKGIETRWSMRW